MNDLIAKDRETYSFSISYGNKTDAIMNNYIIDKLKSGVKISSYVRSLIEKDMITNGVIEDNTAPGGYTVKSDVKELELKLDNITNLLLRLNGENSHSSNYGKDAYEKLVGLEFMLKNLGSIQQATPVHHSPISQNNLSESLILEKLNTLTHIVNNIGSLDVDLSDLDKLKGAIDNSHSSLDAKISELIEMLEESGGAYNNREFLMLNKSIEKLTNKIESQSETIDSLLEIINSQNRQIKQLSMNSQPANELADNTDKDTNEDDNEEKLLAKNKAKKMKKAEF